MNSITHTLPEILVVVGSLCMALALVLAWCLAGVRSSAVMKGWFNYQYLLKAHIDFLMMTGLLFVFFLLFTHLRLTPPAFVVIAMSFGSLANPLGFLALAFKPDMSQRPGSRFGAIMASCFVVTTIGYGSAAWIVARAVVLGAR